MEKSQEELERLLDALRQGKLKGHEISRAVQAFGENNFQVARPEVEALLQSDDFELRFVAFLLDGSQTLDREASSCNKIKTGHHVFENL